MFKHEINPRTFISTLWVFILLNMFLRDLHEFPTEGYIEELMALHLSEELMLLFAFIVEIPILMVVLSRVLPDQANKWANSLAVLFAGLGTLYTLPGGDLDEFFFAIMNAIALVAILLTAWRLPGSISNPAQIGPVDLE